ncbi:S-layer homology domain-containing protein [Oscillibacter sp.]|uniref:S-layer homology domain-containing protein n=1 Tax=Oscillibacter sp. TaxID=1945593 RepID=UPI002D7EA22E|nr:S-layer homology domain-containing protein [Oscillibacter sp.]
MNSFWKRKVPAFFLTLVMLASLAPAALAEEHVASHELNDWRTVKESTCKVAGSKERTCKAPGCNYTETENLPLLAHSFPEVWAYKNETHHQKVCGVCDYEEVKPHEPTGTGQETRHATCTEPGVRTFTCKVCKMTYVQTIPAKGHSTTLTAEGKCKDCGLQIAQVDNATCTVTFRVGSSTSTETVRKNSAPSGLANRPALNSVSGDHIFYGWVQGSLSTPGARNQAKVTAGTVVSGNVTYTALYNLRATGQNASLAVGNTGGTLVGAGIRDKVAELFYKLTGESSFSYIDFSSTSGSGGKIYHNSREDSLKSRYTYSDLSSYVYYVPSTSNGLGLVYTAADQYGNQISGTVTLSGTPKNSSEIVLRVAPGGTVNFKAVRFKEAYEELGGRNARLESVEFRVGSDYKNFYGSIYRNNSALSASDLDKYEFYVDDDDYGDYDLETLSFRADSRADVGDELEITVRYYDRSNNPYNGTLRVIIDKNGRQEGEVVYRVAPGGSVTFNRSDFDQAFRDLAGTDRLLSYIEFVPGDAYTSFGGKISVSGHSDFTKNELGKEVFYYSEYRNSYVIDELIFRASSTARDGDSLEIPFWACHDKDDEVKCTLRIVIDKNGSQDTVTLNVAPGGTARLDKEAFNKVYQYLSDTRRTITAVSFEAPESYRNFDGALYVKNDELSWSELSHNQSWFYYSSRDAGRNDDLLEDVTFQADRNARENASLAIPFRAYYSNDREDYEEGTFRIVVTSEANTITYEAAPGGSVVFTAGDFDRAYQTMSGTSRTIKYVAFEAGSDYASFAGKLYAGNVALTRSDLTYSKSQFYNGTPNYGAYSIGSLYFRPDAAAKDGSYLTMPFRAYYDSSDYEQGTLKLVVGSGGDVSYTVTPGKTVNFDRTKFDDFFRKTYSSSSLDYVVFDVPGTADFPDSSGTLYTGYGTSYSASFSRSGLRDVRFYYNSNDAGRNDYALNDLTFAAASSFISGKVSLRFTAYGTNDREVEGTLVITPVTASVTSNLMGSVRYAVTAGTNVQINANDLARFYKSAYPAGTLQYVVLGDVPAAGALYYNYYGASRYGASSREQITASNRNRNFYVSPASQTEYALTELTYVPTGSNYCAAIPFTAYGTNGQSVTGGILISVTAKAVSEVYGPTPKNTAVTFPASSIAAAVSAATGTTPSGVQLLKLPAANVGTIYVGNTTTPATTTTVYGYNTGSEQLGQLRFVPQTGYTGPVEIPYVALNASNVPIASGMFSMGVLTANKKFGDINAATWCYKYVTELADAAVIDGYADGNFRPDSTITYGAALKLIMLAAGYPEQAPTVPGSTFSGYLAKAQADGLVTRSNVALNGPITRLQVAQLAAGALRLDINNLSSVKPFTDTADVYVQALNAAGIVEGYFNNGTSTFRPSNTLTRGQVSAIVWRMQNYRK